MLYRNHLTHPGGLCRRHDERISNDDISAAQYGNGDSTHGRFLCPRGDSDCFTFSFHLNLNHNKQALLLTFLKTELKQGSEVKSLVQGHLSRLQQNPSPGPVLSSLTAHVLHVKREAGCYHCFCFCRVSSGPLLPISAGLSSWLHG